MNRIALVVGVLLFVVGCQKKAEVVKPNGKFDESDLQGKMSKAVEGDSYSEFLDLREIFVGQELYGSFVPEAAPGQPQKYAAYLFNVPGSFLAKAQVSYSITVTPNAGLSVAPGGPDAVVLLYKLGGGRITKVDSSGVGGTESINDIVLNQPGIYMVVVAEFDLDEGGFWIDVSSCEGCLGVCGDGFVDEGESCDDLGESATCDLDCSDAFCGDFQTNASREESCDAGGVDTVSCDFDCSSVSCGDGYFNAVAEACDTNGDSGSCDGDCTAVACGDGYFNSAAELCDAGGNTADCDSDCTAVACHDGVLNTQAGETCEDADDENPNDGCNNCQLSVSEVVYNIPLEQLANLNGVCSVATNRHNQSNDQPFGFTWTDTAPFVPAAITVEVSVGVMCPSSGGNVTRGITLNGSSKGSQLLNAPAACSCGTAPVSTTFSIDPSGYVQGGTNTLAIVAGTGNEGLSSNPAWGGSFARVTVYATAPTK